jgi:hypothetical protein
MVKNVFGISLKECFYRYYVNEIEGIIKDIAGEGNYLGCKLLCKPEDCLVFFYFGSYHTHKKIMNFFEWETVASMIKFYVVLLSESMYEEHKSDDILLFEELGIPYSFQKFFFKFNNVNYHLVVFRNNGYHRYKDILRTLFKQNFYGIM